MPGELQGDAEVETNRLRVTDVQVAVGLRGNRVWTRPPCFPAARSDTMISRMKSMGAVPHRGVWVRGIHEETSISIHVTVPT